MPEKILLIDDEAALSTAWSIRLKASGYDVTAASDGPLGIAAARANRPSLIMLDIRMPGMNGFEVRGQLKKEPTLSNVPVIFMSANVEDDARRRADELGAVAFLTKPLDAKIVLAAISSALENQVSLPR